MATRKVTAQRAIAKEAKTRLAKQDKPASVATKAAEIAQLKAGNKVRATRTGYYDDARRRAGDVFKLHSPAHFSPRWMEPVDKATEQRITTGQEELRQQHDATLLAKARGGGVGPDNPPSAGGKSVLD